MEQQHGILLIDKPRGPSSAQCVARIKRLGQKKIGHAGTLDPMATGVLVVLLGHATKLSGYLLEGGEKSYDGVLRLGVTTDTWDAEGQILSEVPLHDFVPACEAVLSGTVPMHEPHSVQMAPQAENAGASPLERLAAAVRREVAAWSGITQQPVPPYSAAKHQGKPLYRLARAGQEVPAKVKSIRISHAEILGMDLPDVRFRVTCSSGSYIRSLAHSLGIRLGCGAMLTELTRTYSHPFGLNAAHCLDDVLGTPERLPNLILPLAAALPGWPLLTVGRRESCDVRNGRPVPHRPEYGLFRSGDRAVLLDEDGNPLALVRAQEDRGRPVWTVMRGLFTP